MRRKFISPGGAMRERMNPEEIVRFLGFVEVDANGCWVWKGCSDAKGYGSFKFRGRRRWSHRLAYATFKCPIRAGFDVHHLRKCKSAGCVNPEHLAQRSREWNSADGGRRSAQARKAQGVA